MAEIHRPSFRVAQEEEEDDDDDADVDKDIPLDTMIIVVVVVVDDEAVSDDGMLEHVSKGSVTHVEPSTLRVKSIPLSFASFTVLFPI